MTSRGPPGHSRGVPSGLQPLKATVPFQMACKPRATRREAGKAKDNHQSGMRRTVSLDAIVGPYLQGHWPKEVEGHSGFCPKDKSTQTPHSWSEDCHSGHSGSHKRSASWGSAEQLKEIAKLKQQLQQRSKGGASGGHDKDLHGDPPENSYHGDPPGNGYHGDPPGNGYHGAAQTKPIPIPQAPLSSLVSRLGCSVEGLNQELEGMFVCPSSPLLQRFLEVPDGHRAPVPSHTCSSGSQSDQASTPLSSTSSSPLCSPTDISISPDTVDDLPQGLMESTLSRSQTEPELPLLISSSPGPNKSCCFQREPPEGCEKVRVWEENSTMDQPEAAAITSCPDPNKVNFTPHGGSAFCPVSLLKPLLPSMDLLFRTLSVSPASHLSEQSASSGNASAGSTTEAFGPRLAF